MIETFFNWPEVSLVADLREIEISKALTIANFV
jgi:hypothetical protein